MKVIADIELINAFREGNEDAAKQLYKMHYRSLCYFAERLTGNKAEAEDVAVDSFIKLIHKREDFDSLLQIKSFLFTASRNACIDLIRKKKRQTKSGADFAFLAEQFEEFHDREMIATKVLQLIYAEVELLPDQCRQVFKSIFIENKSTAVIAAEMSISPQTVLNQKNKALQKLRLSLQKEGLYLAGQVSYCLLLFCLIMQLHYVPNSMKLDANPAVIFSNTEL